mmetsp:Transcript_80139/g.249718  ORF Transcript_80139/g.249718 Transcript_80139/m.249718 type:complete len:213 (-) Transcript_80139:35-673(-)
MRGAGQRNLPSCGAPSKRATRAFARSCRLCAKRSPPCAVAAASVAPTAPRKATPTGAALRGVLAAVRRHRSGSRGSRGMTERTAQTSSRRARRTRKRTTSLGPRRRPWAKSGRRLRAASSAAARVRREEAAPRSGLAKPVQPPIAASLARAAAVWTRRHRSEVRSGQAVCRPRPVRSGQPRRGRCLRALTAGLGMPPLCGCCDPCGKRSCNR